MTESKYDPKDQVLPVTVDIQCTSCGFIDFVAGNVINGELFVDDLKCENCMTKDAIQVGECSKRSFND